MRVKALEKIYYNRRDVLPGEIIDMDDREWDSARVLAAVGKIEILKEEKTQAPAAKAPLVETRALAAEEPIPQEQPASHPVGPMTTGSADALTGNTPRRQYRRRDLKAEQ